MGDKKGSEVVEAALVLPLIILIIVSLIGATVFCFDALEQQVEAQGETLKQVRESSSVIKKILIERETSSQPGGLVHTVLAGHYEAEAWALDEAAIIRLGELVYGEA